MQLALFTSSVLLDSYESEKSRPFAEAVPGTFAAAEVSSGFVWLAPRIEVVLDESGTPKRTFPSFYKDSDHIVQTLSTWTDLSCAWNYVYRDTHLSALRKRGEWMRKPVRAQYVLWWLPRLSMPTHADAVLRLETLDDLGSTPDAFTFRTAFDASGRPAVVRG